MIRCNDDGDHDGVDDDDGCDDDSSRIWRIRRMIAAKKVVVDGVVVEALEFSLEALKKDPGRLHIIDESHQDRISFRLSHGRR